MGGQRQLYDYDQESLYINFAEEELKQADSYYLFEKFRIGKGMDEAKTLHAYLYKNMLYNPNCEVAKFIDKQIRGALTDENVDVVDLKTMQTKYRDINNYYYTQPFEWDTASW
jgi:hypothetical protein